MLLLLSRPVFRACEVACNHAARLAASGAVLSGAQTRGVLRVLESKRSALQARLGEIGAGHSRVCADCRGRCCGGPRERDAFIDRILQDPATPHRGARGPRRPDASCAGHDSGCCPELTEDGCRIPYKLRPIQCTAYFCAAAVAALSEEERREGIRALTGLMGVQVRTVFALLRLRLSAALRRRESEV